MQSDTILAWFKVPTSPYVSTKHGDQHIKEVVREKDNYKAGITVAFVSVPLSIALGIASGTTPVRGVATAIFGGLCASLFGSSDYNIVGPAGALSGMFMSYTIQWTDDVLPWISLVSSACVLACALAKLHTYMLFMPTSVFEGFTVGVALIIGLNQINFACGLQPEIKHKHFYMNIYESLIHLDETKWPSLVLFLIQMPTLWYLARRIPKIPWTVVYPLVSIPLGALADQGLLGFELLTLKSKYGMLTPALAEPLKPLGEIVPAEETGSFLIAAFSTSVVAVLETLISAKIASTRVDRGFNEMIEMRGLTVAHVVCGLTGAMPPTGVFVRTSLNTGLGATHKFSQFLNAIVVMIIFMATMPIFSYVPQATIAALLVVASIRMTPISYLKRLWRENKGSLALCVVTALICVFEDPVIGLAVGMALALLYGAKRTLVAPQIRVSTVGTSASETGIMHVVKAIGGLTYLNADVFVEKARKVGDATHVLFDMENLCSLDHDGFAAINKVVLAWQQSVGADNVYFSGVNSQIRETLTLSQWFLDATSAGRVQLADDTMQFASMDSTNNDSDEHPAAKANTADFSDKIVSSNKQDNDVETPPGSGTGLVPA
jgi:SulP family sulfate permease